MKIAYLILLVFSLAIFIQACFARLLIYNQTYQKQHWHVEDGQMKWIVTCDKQDGHLRNCNFDPE